MKKIITLIVTILLLSLVLCGCGEEEKVKLDVANFDKYLHIDVYATDVSSTTNQVKKDGSDAVTTYTENTYIYKVDVKSVSDEFTFENVDIQLIFSPVNAIERQAVLDLKLTADGSASGSITFTSKKNGTLNTLPQITIDSGEVIIKK